MATLVAPRVRPVHATLIVALDEEHGLPGLPPRIEALTAVRQRRPTLAELERYEWFITERGGRVRGVMALREEYDLHANADLLRVDYLVGSARACSDLLKHLGELCRVRGRTVIGSVDVENRVMARMIARSGFAPTRITFMGRG